MYELGKKQLLRKVENNVSLNISTPMSLAHVCLRQAFPTAIMTLHSIGNRVLVGDMQESMFWVAYKSMPSRQLLIFADDAQPRWITSSCLVDYETIAAADKFGNIFINRLPQRVSASVDEDPTGAGILHEKGYLQGAAHKTSMLAHYHVGGIVTSITKTTLVAGGRDVLLYTTLNGSVGVLVPFTSKDDIEFMSTLEMVSAVDPRLWGSGSFPLPHSTCARRILRSSVETIWPIEAITHPSRQSWTATFARPLACFHTKSNSKSQASWNVASVMF